MPRLEYALDQDIIAVRRQRVSSLRNRGLTHEEIWQQLSLPTLPPLSAGEPPRANPSYLVNPDTSKPFDRTTITRDLKWLREENMKLAAQATEEHRARQIGEIIEIKRAAWGNRDPELALKALDREMKLTGTVSSGLTINFNVTLVTQVVEAIERAGLDASDVFNNLLAELANAERTDVST